MTITIFTAGMGIRRITKATILPPKLSVSADDAIYTKSTAKASKDITAKPTKSTTPTAPAWHLVQVLLKLAVKLPTHTEQSAHLRRGKRS